MISPLHVVTFPLSPLIVSNNNQIFVSDHNEQPSINHQGK